MLYWGNNLTVTSCSLYQQFYIFTTEIVMLHNVIQILKDGENTNRLFLKTVYSKFSDKRFAHTNCPTKVGICLTITKTSILRKSVNMTSCRFRDLTFHVNTNTVLMRLNRDYYRTSQNLHLNNIIIIKRLSHLSHLNSLSGL